MVKKATSFIILCLYFVLSLKTAALMSTSTSKSSFVVSFGSLSQDWMEYSGKIPGLLEFTVCHWEYLKYFNKDINSVWVYCIVENRDDRKIKCTQTYTTPIIGTANRHIYMGAWINNAQCIKGTLNHSSQNA